MAKLSVIVPVYNVENYLRRCLDSILQQTYKDIEIIVVDDGSIDDSAQIIKQYVEENSNIIAIYSSNKGVSHARNLGIQHSNGEYIIFVDSDDYILPTFCEKMLQYTQYDLVICHYERKDYCPKTANQLGLESNILVNFPNFLILFESKLLNPPVCRLYSRDLISVFFDENLEYGEDLLFNIEYVKNCSRIKLLDDVLYYYEYNPNSITSTYQEKRVAEIKKVTYKCLDVVTEIFGKNINYHFIVEYYFVCQYVLLQQLIFSKQYSFKEKRRFVKDALAKFDAWLMTERKKVSFKSSTIKLFSMFLNMKNPLLLIIFVQMQIFFVNRKKRK